MLRLGDSRSVCVGVYGPAVKIDLITVGGLQVEECEEEERKMDGEEGQAPFYTCAGALTTTTSRLGRE